MDATLWVVMGLVLLGVLIGGYFLLAGGRTTRARNSGETPSTRKREDRTP